MTGIVDEPWSAGVDVTELTMADLEDSRNASTKISDSSYELHRLVETLRHHEDLPNWSVTCDRALRVEFAYLIDNDDVSFTREEYDIAYMIPPEGWVSEQEFDQQILLARDRIDTSDRGISFSTPPTVKKMAERAIEEGDTYLSLTDMVEGGVKRLLGRK